MHSAITRFVIVTLLILPSSGCLPDAVVWTPDGKSLVWTEDRGTRVVLYDLAKKERHVVEDNTNSQTTWPAVSPDGKLIAIARAVREDDEPGTMEIVLLDREGQEVKNSKEFPWFPADKKAKGKRTFATALHWDAVSNRILVFSEGKTGIYDPDKDALIVLGDVVPLPLGNAPVRPDGKGFLALETGRERTEVAFIDWTGKRQQINLGDKELTAVEARWEKDTARLIRPGGVLDLDTMKLAGELAILFTFPDGKTKVCVYDWVEKSETKRDIPHQRVEIQRLGEKKRDVLERRTRGIMTLYPSPDRKLVAVRYRPEGQATQLIAIIDGNGKIVDEIKVKD
jgi:hypothetical protein